MTQEHPGLTAKSVTVLTMIAEGHTYQQILDQCPELTYLDIFRAAQEALDATERIPRSYHEKLAHVRQKYARAYEKWTAEEETTLIQFVGAGLSEDEIARRLQRQPGAIRSRMEKLKSVLPEPTRDPEPSETEANLEAEFHQKMLEIYYVAAEHSYRATYFKRLVDDHGGLQAAKRLLAKEEVQSGLTRLWELGLLEHSTEALVLRERFHPLFTESERQEARRRLGSLGFVPR